MLSPLGLLGRLATRPADPCPCGHPDADPHALSLPIKSNNTNTPANITCINQQFHTPTIGIMFADMNVTLTDITIIGCGAELRGLNNNHLINSTPPYYSNKHSGLFILVNCYSTFTRVKIIHYYGFAILMIDSQTTLLHKLSVINNNNKEDSVFHFNAPKTWQSCAAIELRKTLHSVQNGPNLFLTDLGLMTSGFLLNSLQT